MRRLTLLIAGISLILTTSASATDFDLIVPKKMMINTYNHTSNILLARYWGMIIATDDAIGESNIFDAEVTYEMDNPTPSLVETGFINVPQATPIPKKTGAGGFRLSPDIDFLEPDETHAFTSPLYIVYFSWPSGFQGSATIKASIKMGFHEAKYETQIDFVFRPDEQWLIRREEAQRVTAKAPAFLPDLRLDTDDLVIRVTPFATPSCDEPEPEPLGCTTLCKPCKRYVCERGEWVARDVPPPPGVCRSKRAGNPYSPKKGETRAAVVACPRTPENLCPTECDLCW